MLANLLDQPRNAINSTWWTWPGDDDAVTSPTGVRVDRNTAMQLMAVYGSVRLISDSISTLPVDVYRRDGDARIEEPAPAWLDYPTPDLAFESWCGQVLTSLLLHGNSFLEVQRARNEILEVTPRDPLTVNVVRERGRKAYRINGVVAPPDRIVHIPGMMLPGTDEGLSPIEYARRTIGLGISAVDYGAEFFAGEGNMPGVIEAPHPMEPDTMRDLAKQWRRKRSTGGRGLPGVLQNGAQWKPTGINHEQAQFLSTRKYSAAEIAGQLFLVDPSDLGIPVEGTSLTYANLQDRNTRRVQVTLLPWIIRLEHAISSLLGPGRYMKFNVDGLLRGDQKTRFETYAIGIEKEILTPDEARAYEDLPPSSISDEPSPRAIAEMIQKIYLGVGVVLSADEARAILSRGGAALPPGYEPTGSPRT